jgi:predicted esterase YcpF (UPF0227 family)
VILYIHGLASCGSSHKAQLVVGHFGRDQVLTPDLPLGPSAAMYVLQTLIDRHPRPLLIGSSLGGYYATWLAEQHGLPAVLINPAVRPYEVLADHIGPVRDWCSDGTLEWKAEYVDQLRLYDCPGLSSDTRLLILLQTGDQVLDYRLAAEKYAEFEIRIEQGGSHAFEGFAARLPLIEAFWRRTRNAET